MAATNTRGTATDSGGQDPLATLESALDALTCRHVDELQVGQCEQELTRLDVVARRIQARQTQLVGALARHRTRTADGSTSSDDRRAGPGDRAGDERRARRGVQDDLIEGLNWTPSKARQATRDADRLARFPELARAFDAGKITSRHVALACDLLEQFHGEQQRELERELVEVATRQNPVDFSKHCRRRLAELAEHAAMRDENARRRRRSVRMTTGTDGMLHLSARLSGVDAEVVATAIHAFRQYDPADVPREHRRNPEQITADSLTRLCEVALGARKAPTRHGVRPHVMVTIDHRTLLEGAGAVDVEHLGTLPFAEVRRLLADAGVSRILTDPDSVPLEAGQQVRTVPAGLWRALKLRDDGCIGPACRIPAEWCQVAHLEQPYRLDGRLEPMNAALMCHLHHTRYDNHGWRIVWRDNKPRLHPPQQSPDRPPDRATRTPPDRPPGRPPHRTASGSADRPPDRTANGSADRPPDRTARKPRRDRQLTFADAASASDPPT